MSSVWRMLHCQNIVTADGSILFVLLRAVWGCTHLVKALKLLHLSYKLLLFFRWWSWAAPQHNGGRGGRHRGQHPSPKTQGQVLDPWQDLQAVEVAEEEKQRQVQSNFRRFVLWTHCVCSMSAPPPQLSSKVLNVCPNVAGPFGSVV